MILIKPDPDRRVHIPGVADPVPRPVDIDSSTTGFSSLRTLRIYQFAEGCVIDGHAEEDEVFIFVLSGSIELTIVGVDGQNSSGPMKLGAPDEAEGSACVAYLPPTSAYHLAALETASVAYTRATPSSSAPPQWFFCSAIRLASGVNLLWEEFAYAQRLRARILRFNAADEDITFAPIYESEAGYEGLVHVTIHSPDGTIHLLSTPDTVPLALASGDTIAAAPGEQIRLECSRGSVSTVFVFLAAHHP